MLLVLIRKNAIRRNKKGPNWWTLTSPGHGRWTEAKGVEYGVGLRPLERDHKLLKNGFMKKEYRRCVLRILTWWRCGDWYIWLRDVGTIVLVPP